MFNLSRIMVPVVFSENCRGAMQYASALATRFGAEVSMVHILEPLVNLDMESRVAVGEVDRYRRDWVAKEFDRLYFAASREIPLQKAFLEGDPATEIVRYAESTDVDLIVMATHGYGPFRRLLLGSVTAKVLHDAGCPVWTGKHLEKALVPGAIHTSNIACAVDFGPQTDAVVDWAAGFASKWEGKLTLIHVLPCPPADHGREIAEKVARDGMEQRREHLHIQSDIVITAGPITASLCGTANRAGADLLVIGRGHGDAGGRLPSSSYSIIREAACPVVSI